MIEVTIIEKIRKVRIDDIREATYEKIKKKIQKKKNQNAIFMMHLVL